jgi:hypothetical protein
MDIQINQIPRSTLSEFADQHGLKMVVEERFPADHWAGRYYASFERADVLSGTMLVGEMGNGPTPGSAIADYGWRISRKTLVIDAMRETRRKISVPIITPTAGNEE